MKIMLAFGTRACTIKMAPIYREAKRRNHEALILYSGQHYSPNLYEELFYDLELPEPHYDIKATGSPIDIGSKILVETKKILDKERPDIVLTHGDTYSALFFSLAGAICMTPVGHIEAGLRTYSWEPFPEQICTRTSDACSSLYFAPTEKNKQDLISEHFPDERIFVVGNSVVDAVKEHSEIAERKSTILKDLKLKNKKPLVFWSVHRKENLIHKNRMKGIFDALLEMEDIYFFCSVLPSTQHAADRYGYSKKLEKASHIIWTPCLPKYTDALKILMNSDLCLTDSGGLQEECICLKIPTLTLRYVTDRPETIHAGGNKCIGFKKEDIIKETKRAIYDPEVNSKMKSAPNPYGDGNTSKKIIDIIEMFEGKMERWETNIVKQ